MIRPKSVTTTAPTPRSVIFSAASPIESDGSTVRMSRFMISATMVTAASISVGPLAE